MTEEIDFDNPAFQQAAIDAKSGKTAVVETTETTTVEDENTETTTEETQETTTTETTETTVETPNYAEYLSTKSGGLFKSEDDFIAALEKVKNYDSLETKLKDTETRIPQFKNETQQKIFEAFVNGQEDEIKAYWAEKDKPYATMSSLDVMRNALKDENKTWDDKRVELELRHKYGINLEKIDTAGLDPEDDKDELKEANAHNKEVEKNLELLEMHAYDKRIALIDRQKQIALPELKKAETTQTPQLTDAEIAEGKLKWQKNIEETLPKLSNIKADIDDKGVEYVSTDEDKASLQATLKDFNIFKFFGETRGWQNTDKTWNALKIAEDVRLLTEGQKVIKSIAGQVKTEAIRATMAKIKGIDPNYQELGQPKTFATLEEAAHAKMQEVRKKRASVEYEEQD